MPKPSVNRLPAPALTASIGDVVDWLELIAIIAQGDAVNRSTVHNWLDFAENREDLPVHQELDEKRESLILDVFAELRRRATAATPSFPFTVEEARDSFKLRSQPWTAGHYAYLFGVFSTEATLKRFLNKHFFTDEERQIIPDLLQILATIAAAGYVQGCASSFGWPRPNGSQIRDALKDLTSSYILEGEVRPKPLPGTAIRAKDGGIDVIAWRHFPDSFPGKLLLLGQCATGRNWDSKGVRAYAKTFFDDYFSTHFACEPIEAIFIPFCLSVSKDHVLATDTRTTIGGLFRHYASKLGVVVDRCRLACLLPGGMLQFNQGEHVERGGDLGNVKNFVDVCVDWLQQSYSAA